MPKAGNYETYPVTMVMADADGNTLETETFMQYADGPEASNFTKDEKPVIAKWLTKHGIKPTPALVEEIAGWIAVADEIWTDPVTGITICYE